MYDMLRWQVLTWISLFGPMKPCTKGTVCVDECNRAEGVCSKGLRAELRGRKLAGFEWSPSSIPSATEKKT